MMENSLEESVGEQPKGDLDQFYESFGQAEAAGHLWEYDATEKYINGDDDYLR